MDYNKLMDILLENLKKVFFPQEWLNLDMAFSKSEVFAMLLIDKKNEITMTELSEYIHCPMSTATGIIDRLVKNGYIVRDRSENDRRIVVLKLSQKGADEMSKLKTLISSYIDMAVKNLTQTEIHTIIGIAEKIVDIISTNNAQDNENKINKEVKKIEID